MTLPSDSEAPAGSQPTVTGELDREPGPGDAVALGVVPTLTGIPVATGPPPTARRRTR